VLNLHSKAITDDSLQLLLNTAPQRSIILLEDIDAAIEAKSNVTFSGLLNALDGVTATEGGGRILFMTTNNYKSLHPALIRPGRVDVREEFDLASKYQIRKIFLKFFPDEFERAERFSEKHPEKTYSMAELQGHLLRFKTDPEGALNTPLKKE
jgi:chaperone BCS1